MFDTYELGRFHPNAFPRVLRVASLALSTVIVGLVFFQAFVAGAGIVA